MRVAIVDDRPEDRERLVRVLRHCPACRGFELQTDAFSSGEDFTASSFAGRYDLIFLDVYLGEGMTGIQTAEQIRRLNEKVLLVFLTTSNEHQAEAIHWHVYDYLTDIADGTCTLKGNIRLPVNIRNASRLERAWTSYTFEKIRRQSQEETDDAP